MRTYEQAFPIYLKRIARGEDKIEAAWSALWEPGNFITDLQAKEFQRWVMSR